MLIAWINDSMSSSEKRIAIQNIVAAVDAAIINNEESCVFDIVFERRLDASTLFNRMNTPISLQQGHRLNLSLIAKPFVSYRENRLSQYSDRSFTKKLLSKHGSILDKVYTSIIGYSNPVFVCSHSVGRYSDGWEGGIEFSELGMTDLENSFQTHQMTLALIEFLSSKGFVCSIPKACYFSGEIAFSFCFSNEVNGSQGQLKSW